MPGTALLTKRWRVGLATGSAVAMVVGIAVVATNAQAAAGCQAKYTVMGQWSGAFQASVDVTNLGDQVSDWRLAWTFPSGQKVTQMWNANASSSGSQVTATNAGYNSTIGTNSTVSFGFIGSWSGTNAAPTTFTLNGTACTGGVTASTPPTSQPPPSQLPPSVPPSSPPPSTPPAGDAMAAVAAMQPGWNLGNTLDSTGSDETSWGNPRITKALIDNIQAQGFKSIRIPVTWSAHQGPAPSYTVEAAYMSRVKEVVDWALAADLYVMLNVHHDSWQWISAMPTNHDAVLAQYNALWTQIATAFKGESAKLVLESVNEPQFTNPTSEAQSFTLLAELNTSFHTIVRTSGGNNTNRLLVIPTLHTSNEQAKIDPLVSWINGVNDRNIIVTVHEYGYWPFSTNIAGGTRFDAETQKYLTEGFDRIYNAFVAKNIPVIIGEYGLLGFDKTLGAIEQGELLKFFEYFGYYARTKKITTMWWDNGQHFRRTPMQWRDPELFAQIKSSWTTRSGTASSDQVYVSKTGAITSKSLTLNLNGTTFEGLRQGTTDLVKGTDYTVTGDQLTLSAALLTRLVGAQAYGVNADLQARFSAGVPWRISIITYDTPVLSNITGATSGLAVPVAFRGDQLATMEAKYADGSGAGPNDWTTFKEFESTFSPNYTANTITLKKGLLDNIREGVPVTLVFHFWSGAKLTYTVTKSGSSVTGTTA